MNVKTDMNDIIFEFLYITNLGNIDKVKTQINGKAFYAMLAGCNLKKRPIFLHDKTPYKSNTEMVHYTLENRNIHWSYPQNQVLTQNNSFFSQFTNGQPLSQYSENNEMINYQNPTSLHLSQNSTGVDNTFMMNMSQNSIQTQEDYHRRSRNQNRNSFNYIDI